MKSLLIAILVSLGGLTWLGIVTSQEPAPRAPSKEAPTFDELEALLFYLAGEAPSNAWLPNSASGLAPKSTSTSW